MLNRRSILWTGAVGVVAVLLLAPLALVGSQRAVATTFNSPMDWVPQSFPERVRWADFTERFQLGEVVMLSWPSATLDNPQMRIVADAISDAEPDSVRSATAGSEVFNLLQSGVWGVTEREAAQRLEGSIIGSDGQQTLVVVQLTKAGSLERNSLIPKLKRIAAEATELPIAEIRAVGIPVEGSVIDASAADSIATFAVPSALLAILICWTCLRSVWLTLAISVVAMVGQGLALAGVLLTGEPMNAILIVLPPLVFVLTVSSGIHLANYFLEAVHVDRNQEILLGPQQTDGLDGDLALSAVQHALRAGVVPCILASFTTIIGLASLTIVPIVPVRHFGILAAASIALTLLLLLMILPASMLMAAKRILTKSHRSETILANKQTERTAKQRNAAHGTVALRTWKSRLQRFIDWCFHLPVKHPLSVTIAVLMVASVFAAGLKNVETSVSITSLFAANHPMRKDYEWFEEHVGPTVFGELQLRFSNATETDPIERLKLANRVHRTVADQPEVKGVLSAGIFLPLPPRSRSITNRPRLISITSQISNLEPSSPLVAEGLIAKSGTDEFWRISYRVPLDGKVRHENRLVAMESAVQEVLADSDIKAEVLNTGGVMLFEAAQASLLRGLLESFITAFGIVAVVMMFLLRSVVGGCLAMIPNILPTLVTFGFLGLTRTPLDIGAVMTASLALGIAVDDTVHLLSRFSSFKRLGHSASEATLAALRQCAPAMAQTTLVCGLSLMVYILSDFLPTKRFSLLMACLLSTAIVGDLLLLPAILSSRLGNYFARPVLSTDEALAETDSIL